MIVWHAIQIDLNQMYSNIDTMDQEIDTLVLVEILGDWRNYPNILTHDPMIYSV